MPLSYPPAPSSRNLAGPLRMAGSATQKTRMEGDTKNYWKKLTIFFPRQAPKRPEEEALPLYRAKELPPREVLPASAGRCSQTSVAAVWAGSRGGTRAKAGPIGISALCGREGSQLRGVRMGVVSAAPPCARAA